MAELNLLPDDKKHASVSVLKAASGGLLLASSVIAPNLLQLFAKALDTNFSAQKTLRAIRYAKKQGWLTFEETENGVKVALTENGKLKWKKINLNQPLEVSNWDKKWRFIIFDIPVGNKVNADHFRRHLKRLGIKKLQQSVWVTPYPCLTHIAALRQLYEIKNFVRLIEAETIENEAELKTIFHLQ